MWLVINYLRLDYELNFANVQHTFEDSEKKHYQSCQNPPQQLQQIILQVRTLSESSPSNPTSLYLVLLVLTWVQPTLALLLWNLATQRSLRTLKVRQQLVALKIYFFLGARTTPSVVAFTEDDSRLIGDIAKRQVCF